MAIVDTKLTEMTLPEEKVLEKLNAVSTAKRLANMVGVMFANVALFMSFTLVNRSYMTLILEKGRR